MTLTGENRCRYADTHPEDRRPSRFYEVEAYAAWAARADAWAEVEGLTRPPRRRRPYPEMPAPRPLRYIGGGTWSAEA